MSNELAKPRMGRPSSYSAELADKICLRLMEGDSLRSICDGDDFPARSTVLLWVLNHKEFQEKYDLARKVGADAEFDDIKFIADTPELGKKVTTRGAGEKAVTEVTEGDMVEHRKLRIHARMWSLARKDPKKFGDRLQQEHSGPGGGPIQVDDVSLTDEERATAVLQIFEAARKRKKDSDEGGSGVPQG